jgi:hypothetical protein
MPALFGGGATMGLPDAKLQAQQPGTAVDEVSRKGCDEEPVAE